MYQYRWLNPNGGEQPEAVLAWQTVVPNNPHIGTVQDKVDELLAYTYDGKPVYQVRPLYAGPIL